METHGSDYLVIFTNDLMIQISITTTCMNHWATAAPWFHTNL